MRSCTWTDTPIYQCHHPEFMNMKKPFTWAYNIHTNKVVIPHCQDTTKKSPHVVMNGICYSYAQQKHVNGTPDQSGDHGGPIEVTAISDGVVHCQDIMGSCRMHKTVVFQRSNNQHCNHSQHSSQCQK